MIALVTEYWLDGSVHRYAMTRDELRLHMPALGARVTVRWVTPTPPVDGMDGSPL